MTNVYAWPPVGLTGWEITRSDPISESRGFFGGRSYRSSRGRARRLVTANAQGIGSDMNGAGYIENLKRLLAGGEHLVRIDALPPLWVWAEQRLDLRSQLTGWTSGGAELLFTSGGIDVAIGDGSCPLSVVPTVQAGWPALTVSGLPAFSVVARPSQRITVTDGVTTEATTVLTEARSDASGVATIRLFETLTLSGPVSIGDRESLLLEPLEELPRAVQPLSGNWGYQWSFREVFADEYTSLTELDPWG